MHLRGQNKYLASRYKDLFKPKDTRSGEEIALDVIEKAGLILKGGGDECI